MEKFTKKRNVSKHAFGALLGVCLLGSPAVKAQTNLLNDESCIIWVDFDTMDEATGFPLNMAPGIADKVTELYSTYSAPTYEPGKVGNAATFAELDNQWSGWQTLLIPFNDKFVPTDNKVTLAAWVNPKELHEWVGFMSWGTDDEGDRCPWALQMWVDGAPRCVINWTEGYNFHNGDPELIVPDEWHHVAMAFDGEAGTGQFYVDGFEAGTFETTEVMYTDYTQPVAIGCDFGGGNEFLEGQVDELRAFNRVLTSQEINDLMNFEGAVHATDAVAFSAYVSAGMICVTASLAMQQVTVVDVLGKEVASVSPNAASVQISTAGLAPGVYVVKSGDNLQKVLIK